GSATGGVGTGGVGGSSGEGGADEETCAETPLVERRIVRLSVNQIANSLEALVDSPAVRDIRTTEEIEAPEKRAFPPLAANGNTSTQSDVELVDRVGGVVGRAVRDEFTTCGDAPTDACARTFVADFAEKAFRRPLLDDERASILTVYDECKTLGGTVAEAV